MVDKTPTIIIYENIILVNILNTYNDIIRDANIKIEAPWKVNSVLDVKTYNSIEKAYYIILYYLYS